MIRDVTYIILKRHNRSGVVWALTYFLFWNTGALINIINVTGEDI
jgi:hypothetical protein